MFPKDYWMEKDELVKMWMAQGYLKETPSRDMEIVGEQYFQVLAARSFFQDIQKKYREDIIFKIHDIVHDFAQYMTENECLTVDDNKLGEASVETSIGRVRHLSMILSTKTSFPSSIHRAKGLRSLLIDNSGDPWLEAALPDVMKQLTCIRSLNLSWASIKEIPKEVGKLIHLRHLNLKACEKLVSLPETICDLCNLQSLDVRECDSLIELPRAIGKLIKLRHLCIYNSGVAFMPKGIERLTCLQTLDCFIVCGSGENESKAANLRELKNLDHIGGSLLIKNLRGGIENAAEAQLKNKKRLLFLELRFCINHEDDNLIEVLQPSSDLERLRIDNYGGIVLPNWMMALTRLQELQLVDCGNLEVLPPLGRLPNLESLSLGGVGVRRLGVVFLGIEEVEDSTINEGEVARATAFPKLKTLVIWNLYKLEEWDGIERRVGEEDATTTSTFIMPQLRVLQICRCPLLRALPDYVLAASLQDLKLNSCRNLEVFPPLGRLPSLEFLRLESMGVRRLGAGFLGIEEVENANINEGEIARVTAFPKLKRLQIENHKEVEEWDGIERRVGEGDATTTSIFIIMPQLRELIIDGCPLLRALPDYVLAASLQEHKLYSCVNLEVLPPLGRLPNLESMSLGGVGVRRLDAGFLGIEEVENANNINEGEIARVTAFLKLKRLFISCLDKLEEWDGIERRVGEEDATTTSIFIMPQLQQLEIHHCPLLRALPHYVLAAPLQLLDVRDCPNLWKRYGKEKGEDHHKISHIPKVFISSRLPSSSEIFRQLLQNNL